MGMRGRQRKITERDLEVLDVIKKYFKKHGYAPSIREICDEAQLKGPSTVYTHMKKLFEFGLLESEAEWGSPRAFRVAKRGKAHD